ncbi:hypothetical protein AYR62_08195 [Secundilactobacillus paracollinoides]|uniref:DNA polymerase III subunit delta' n=1 Tax=Secundilactobacillus paracollinoides TaxID=240427 RepID=UPI00081AA3E8|nr:DNA polymerase III subunit delta' [Secundilactobacillus paracollinoides]ANZ64059.1 hypothetical protein AYR62_08195 [Secundilactobacillus paracollinoides]
MITETTINEAQQKQPKLYAHFMHLVQQNRLTHAYLFAGLAGCGKKAVAQAVAMALFCEHPEPDGAPCGVCTECQRILAGDSPDVVMVSPDGQRIKVDQVRYIKDEFAKSPVEGSMKIFIIEGANTLTTNAANSLLKFIEEPVANRVIFLLTTNKSLILPTIISRTQLVEFSPVAADVFAAELAAEGISRKQTVLLSQLTNSLEQAKALTTDDWLGHLQHELARWYTQLAKRDATAFVTVQTGLMPLATDRERQSIVLDAIIILWQTTLMVKYQQTDLPQPFPDSQADMQTVAQSITQRDLLAIVTEALATKKALNGNMNFQSIIETLTLSVLDGLAE